MLYGRFPKQTYNGLASFELLDNSYPVPPFKTYHRDSPAGNFHSTGGENFGHLRTPICAIHNGFQARLGFVIGQFSAAEARFIVYAKAPFHLLKITLPPFAGYFSPQTRFRYPYNFYANPAEIELCQFPAALTMKFVSNKQTFPKPPRLLPRVRPDKTRNMHAELVEEIKQLRAALMIYQEIARRTENAQNLNISTRNLWN